MSYHRSTYSTFSRAYGQQGQGRVTEQGQGRVTDYEQRRIVEEALERQRRTVEALEYEQRRIVEEALEYEQRRRQIREAEREAERREAERRDAERQVRDAEQQMHEAERQMEKLPKNIQAAFNGLTTLDKARLSPWYRRLVFITDQNSKVADFVYKQISECLKDADSNHELANILYTITDNAHDTCDDRVALSVIYLGLQQSLNEYKKSIGSNLPYVYNLLINGFLTIELLYELARYKVAASQNVDEIEVYLGYLIKTKKVLEIPINLNEMGFPDLANISSDDVAVAVERVQKVRNDPQTCHQFLIQQPIWIDILTNKFKDAVETITNTRNENDDYVEALNTYTKSMVELSIHCYRSEVQNTRQAVEQHEAVEHDIQN